MSGLVIQDGREIRLRKALDDLMPDVMYNTREEKSHPHFQAFTNFHGLMDNTRRMSIKQIYDEMLRRIDNESATEKESVIKRVDEIIKAFSDELPIIEKLIKGTAVAAQQDFENNNCFYLTVIDIAEKEKNFANQVVFFIVLHQRVLML